MGGGGGGGGSVGVNRTGDEVGVAGGGDATNTLEKGMGGLRLEANDAENLGDDENYNADE